MEQYNNEISNNAAQQDSMQTTTSQTKFNNRLAKLSLPLGIIGTLFSIGIGFFFILMFALFFGFVLISEPLYIVTCSIIALIGTILGITSIALGAKYLKYHKTINIIGILLGLIATSIGILDLNIFFINANF